MTARARREISTWLCIAALLAGIVGCKTLAQPHLDAWCERKRVEWGDNPYRHPWWREWYAAKMNGYDPNGRSQ